MIIQDPFDLYLLFNLMSKIPKPMEQQSTLKISDGKNLIKAILIAGLIIGLLDGLAACISAYVQREVTPDRVWRYVASGVFGKDAFAGGIPMAFMGLFFHFVIATGWTALFFLLYSRVKFLSWNKYVIGIGYGVFVMFAMNLVVVPLSNVPNPNTGSVQLPQLFIHMFIIGVPISLLANRSYCFGLQARRRAFKTSAPSQP